MRNINWTQLVLVNLLVVLFILLTFLPGPPNKLIYILGMISASLGFFGLILVPIGLFMLRSRHRNVSLLLVTLPLIALCTRLFIVPLASNYSREFAIERGQKLVSSIEEFRTREGHYPESINELKGDVPSPLIMGIDKFRYTRYKDEYYLAFSQWPDGGVTEEIVLFRKDTPAKENISAENYDYNNDYHRVLGAFVSYDTKHDNWRYYLCD